MALVTINRTASTPPVIESDDYIYIHGVGHDKATLSPVYGEYTNVPSYNSPTFRFRKTLTGPTASTPDALSALLTDTTLMNPAHLGIMYPMAVNPNNSGTVVSKGDSNSIGGTGTRYVLYSTAGDNKRTAFVSSGAAAIYGCYISQIVSFVGNDALMLGDLGNTTAAYGISRYATNGVLNSSTAIVTATYNKIPCLISESASHWFMSLTSGATNPTTVGLFAINKTTLVSTTSLTGAAQGTAYPTPTVSNAYSVDTNNKYAYLTISNAADPVYTIRYINFNQSTITGATAGNCTIDWGGSSSSAQFGASSRTAVTSILRTWVVTTGTASYVCFALQEGVIGNTETASNMKMYVFTINSGTPSSLTFKQTVSIGATHGYIRSVFPITDDWSKVAVVTGSAAHLYTFSDANGYQLGTSISANIFGALGSEGALGVDELGRIWVQDAGGVLSNVHVYSATNATTITLNFAASSYNYTGTTINSSFNLSAYNASGSRVVANIQVICDSPNITFSDDTTTKTITTSAGGETTQNVKITGPGQVRMVANVAV